jgi:hypothetical protein
MKPLPPRPDDWKMQPGHTGIVRKGKEFVVANLRTDDVDDDKSETESYVEVAVLWLYRSGAEMWDTKQLDMPYDHVRLVEFEWATDTVFSFDGFICWVDYHRGIMYCDVFSPKLELGFLRFPGIEMWRGDRGPNMSRTVSVCKDHLKFVTVDNGKFQSTNDNDNLSFGSDDDHDDEFKERFHNGSIAIENEWSITTCTLKMPELE